MNCPTTVLYCTVLQMFPLVGIGSGASGQEQDEARQQLLGEDRDTVTLVTPGTDLAPCCRALARGGAPHLRGQGGRGGPQ